MRRNCCEVHNLYTNPALNDARAQEKWQGVTGIKPAVRTAFKANSPKRKSALSVATTVAAGSKRYKTV